MYFSHFCTHLFCSENLDKHLCEKFSAAIVPVWYVSCDPFQYYLPIYTLDWNRSHRWGFHTIHLIRHIPAIRNTVFKHPVALIYLDTQYNSVKNATTSWRNYIVYQDLLYIQLHILYISWLLTPLHKFHITTDVRRLYMVMSVQSCYGLFWLHNFVFRHPRHIIFSLFCNWKITVHTLLIWTIKLCIWNSNVTCCAIRKVFSNICFPHNRIKLVLNNPTLNLLTYLLTYLRSWALLEKLPIVQLLKNFPAF
jgi:hypothetical protein